MTFRPDINGLRAIAVLGVLLFHFDPDWLPGGFAGVDVFFVISGYLMTAIILNGIHSNKFNLFRFYLSRANRIIPPLAVLCLAVGLWGYFFLPVYDFRVVGRDIVGSLTFTSSIIFGLKQDYFEGSSNFLLHTWSLSTEWQFYIIYPVLLLLVHRYVGNKHLKTALLIGFVMSFATSIYGTAKFPSAAYYVLPTRAWEMLAGGLGYIFPVTLSRLKCKVVELLGLLLIVVSYATVNEDTPWPGYMAFLPVLGAYLIILANSESSIFTNNKLFQQIGKWSYSIYLWHWPIAVGLTYYYVDERLVYAGFLISILLGYLSYQFIESIKISATKVPYKLAAYGLCISLFAGLGGFIYATNGMAFKEPLSANSLIYGGMDNEYRQDEGIKLLNTTSQYNYILIGDSKAGHLVRGILQSGEPVKLSWYADCLSMPTAYSYSHSYGSDWSLKCKNNFKTAVNDTADVIISQRWVRDMSNSPFYCHGQNCGLSGDYKNDLALQLNQLVNLLGGNRHLYIIGELARPIAETVEKCNRTQSLLLVNLNCPSQGESIDVAVEMNQFLQLKASEFKNVHFIDPGIPFCKSKQCVYAINSKSIYQPDLGHLTGLGAELTWTAILKEIKTFEKSYSNNDAT